MRTSSAFGSGVATSARCKFSRPPGVVKITAFIDSSSHTTRHFGYRRDDLSRLGAQRFASEYAVNPLAKQDDATPCILPLDWRENNFSAKLSERFREIV